jgi:threonine dehydrogenase-like Zn-dependent dehydrogenase
VTIPAHHFQHVLDLVANFRFDPAKMRELIMPSHAAAAAGAAHD